MNNEEKILSILTAMQSDIAELKTNQASMQSSIARLEANQTSMQDTITEMQDTITEMQDTITEMQDTLKRVAVTQEGVVLPRLQALYEGHDAIMHQLKGKADAERVEKLEEHTNMLHNSVKQLRVDVDALKKAQ